MMSAEPLDLFLHCWIDLAQEVEFREQCRSVCSQLTADNFQGRRFPSALCVQPPRRLAQPRARLIAAGLWYGICYDLLQAAFLQLVIEARVDLGHQLCTFN